MEKEQFNNIINIRQQLKQREKVTGREFKQMLIDATEPENQATITQAIQGIPDDMVLNGKMKRKILNNKIIKKLLYRQWKNLQR